ncbi:family 16 glycosylhydrolase [Evansella sp. AB-rgal1]|uniref:glycoside hydrolase family 16 protein n=1 Tax=Evansella sp. AB-rgal1 TaxID=3242696 RepID=UPI00359DA823
MRRRKQLKPKRRKQLKLHSVCLSVIIPLSVLILLISEGYFEKDYVDKLWFSKQSLSESLHEANYHLGVGKREREKKEFSEDSNGEDKTDYFHEAKKEGWNLIWQDEFERNELDENKWNTEYWAAEKNNELQFYTPNNVRVSEGNLHLVSRREDYKGRHYTSGAIHTKDKFSFRYGKAEMKAKLPSGQGIFPAFWMMPNIDQTWLPEIDIMEMLGHKPDEIWMVLHWLDEKNKLTSVSTMHKGVDYSQNFHTYSVEWSPTEVVWYIDDIERFRTSAFVPNVDMYLYVNTAIGGDWPGRPDNTTIFPQLFEVEYVRVYERGDN